MRELCFSDVANVVEWFRTLHANLADLKSEEAFR